MDNQFSNRDPIDTFNKVYNRIDKKNPTRQELKELRAAFEACPEVWHSQGDIAQKVISYMLKPFKSPAFEQSVQYKLKAIRHELGAQDANGLDRLLIENIVQSWLSYQLASMYHELAIQEDASDKRVNHLERRLNGAHRRYIRAISTLAKIKKIAPAIQINLARNQMNSVGNGEQL